MSNENENYVDLWWRELNFNPDIDKPRSLRKGDKGDDVLKAQKILKELGFQLVPDGDFGPNTEKAVMLFQKREGLVVDGILGAKSLSVLNNERQHGLLTEKDIENAANELGVVPAVIKAVNEVESRGSGFFKTRIPAILFERHIMYRRLKTNGIDPTPFMEKFPNIVNTSTGGYIGGFREYERLTKAMDIHETSALESASWGAYQIMGFHWKMLGYESVQDFIDHMDESEAEHLKAFVRFIKADSVLLDAMKRLDWTTWARRYNGPGYAANSYDVKLAKAFERYNTLSVA